MKRPEFTPEQENWLCAIIGDWYLHWKEKIAGNKPHKLGIAKEMLKMMICEPQAFTEHQQFIQELYLLDKYLKE